VRAHNTFDQTSYGPAVGDIRREPPHVSRCGQDLEADFAAPSFRLAITTRVPWRANALAVARPIPLLSPVTIATLSLISHVWIKWYVNIGMPRLSLHPSPLWRGHSRASHCSRRIPADLPRSFQYRSRIARSACNASVVGMAHERSLSQGEVRKKRRHGRRSAPLPALSRIIAGGQPQ
jgi:hypothetical protein